MIVLEIDERVSGANIVGKRLQTTTWLISCYDHLNIIVCEIEGKNEEVEHNFHKNKRT